MSEEGLQNKGIALIDSLKQAIAEILHANDMGISEYELISQLEDCPQLTTLLERKNGDTLALFRIHFLVCHVLYLLMQEWYQDGTACLEISALNIQRHPYQSSDAAIAGLDKVRDYYLDLNNLLQIEEREIDELIASFWVGMNRFEHRDEALAVLGLADPVDDDTIRKTYRGLVMQHHPDRGGGKQIIQQLNEAAHLLLKTK